jgi:hypothetical protein
MDFGLPKQNFGHLSASSTSNVCEVDIGDFELSSLLLASKYSGLRWVIGIDTVSYNLALIKSNRLGVKSANVSQEQRSIQKKVIASTSICMLLVTLAEFSAR